MAYKTHIDDGDWSGPGGNGVCAQGSLLPHIAATLRVVRPPLRIDSASACPPGFPAAALEKLAMDITITNAAPMALSTALNQIRTRPGSVWPLPQVSPSDGASSAQVAAAQGRRRCRLPADACWGGAFGSPLPQFGRMQSEDGYAVRWVPDPGFVSPCDGERGCCEERATPAATSLLGAHQVALWIAPSSHPTATRAAVLQSLRQPPTGSSLR